MKKPKRSGAVDKPTHLLDTSTLLWALASPEQLSPRVRRLVDTGEVLGANDLVIDPVTTPRTACTADRLRQGLSAQSP